MNMDASWLVRSQRMREHTLLEHHGSAAGIPCHPSHPRAVRLSERHADAVGSLPLVFVSGQSVSRCTEFIPDLTCVPYGTLWLVVSTIIADGWSLVVS